MPKLKEIFCRIVIAYYFVKRETLHALSVNDCLVLNHYWLLYGHQKHRNMNVSAFSSPR